MSLASNHSKSLKQIFNLPTLTLYGIGGILGAGIYAILGEVSKVAGTSAWISFGIAFLVSLSTALSYAELGSRYPRSGAEPYFLERAFHRSWLSSLVGWLIFASCIVSMAALAQAFGDYLKEFWPTFPSTLLFIAFLLTLGLINFWGMRESSFTSIAATLVEIAGLLIVVVAGTLFLANEGSFPPRRTVLEALNGNGILKGAALAFFAFIGFESLVNIADEVRRPERNIPYAILLSCIAAGILYMAVCGISVRVLSSSQLVSSTSPLMEVVRSSPLDLPDRLFICIALFAVFNTALLNSITASRLLYGMSRQSLLPKIFSRVDGKRRTPCVAISAVTLFSIGVTLLDGLMILAGTTSMVLLVVFLAVNLTLLVLKKKEPFHAGFRIPAFFPILAGMGNLLLIIFLPLKSQICAGGILILGLLFLGSYHLVRRQRRNRFFTKISKEGQA